MDTISPILRGKEVIINRQAIKAILVAFFVLTTAIGAYVRIPIPFSPVPITLQTFFVILCGAIMGRKLGSLTQISYVLLGGLGAPIFQGYGAGFAHLAGPTGGYLAGFIVAAFVTGSVVDRFRPSINLPHIVLAMTLGLVTVYIFGLSWLIVAYKFELFKAVSLGFIPFVPGALAKLFLATWMFSKLHAKTDTYVQK